MRIRTIHRRILAWCFAAFALFVFVPFFWAIDHLAGGLMKNMNPADLYRPLLGAGGWIAMTLACVRYATARQPEATFAGQFSARLNPLFRPGDMEISKLKLVGLVAALGFIAIGSSAILLAASGLIDDQMQHWFFD